MRSITFFVSLLGSLAPFVVIAQQAETQQSHLYTSTTLPICGQVVILDDPYGPHAHRACSDTIDVPQSSTLTAARRTYHPEALAWVATEPPGSAEVPTHLKIEGEVAYVAREVDGDIHIRLCHNGRCMVAECIPGLVLGEKPYAQGPIGQEACAAIHIGQRIAVWGISRYDGAPGHREQAEGTEGRREHWEIHPVEGIEGLP